MVVELELHRLQRQYRILEGDRKAYAEDAKQQMHKQLSSIEKLRKENVSLAEELRMVQHHLQEGKRSDKKVEQLKEQLGALHS